jgi:XapX domain-containing protein
MSLIAGILVGLFFKLIGFPIPAPGNLEGILGIIGIFLGYIMLKGA